MGGGPGREGLSFGRERRAHLLLLDADLVEQHRVGLYLGVVVEGRGREAHEAVDHVRLGRQPLVLHGRLRSRGGRGGCGGGLGLAGRGGCLAQVDAHLRLNKVDSNLAVEQARKGEAGGVTLT